MRRKNTHEGTEYIPREKPQGANNHLQNVELDSLKRNGDRDVSLAVIKGLESIQRWGAGDGTGARSDRWWRASV